MNSPPSTAGSRLLPCFLAFVASFCIMVIELVGGRIIARHVGASLYTWTSLIGVILAGITLGNWIGGHLADLFPPRKTLCALFFLASLASFGVPLLDEYVGSNQYVTGIETWPLRIAVHVTLVFLLPATCLGLIGPVVAKLALDQGRATGKTVGTVYAWGALGSIAGTFITGFLLIQLMGTRGVVFSVAGVLSFVGMAISPIFGAPFLGFFVLAIGLQARFGPFQLDRSDGRFVIRANPDENCLYVDETQYSYIEITTKVDEEQEGGEYRNLTLDNLIHAHYVPGKPGDLRYDYEKIYAAVTYRFMKGKDRLHAFFLGGGGYVFPRYLLSRWPKCSIEVAEIDPGVTRADLAKFGLTPEQLRIAGSSSEEPPPEANLDPEKPLPIVVHHKDARNRVDELVKLTQEGRLEPFDFIYGDAFNDFAVPSHLTTQEFHAKLKAILRPKTGLYLGNIIDIYHSGLFLGAIWNTMRKVFPNVYIYSSTEGGVNEKESGRDTYIVIGALQPLDLENLGLAEDESDVAFEGSLLEEKHLTSLEQKSRGIVLTDDYAPVENLLEPVVRRR